MPKQAEPTIKLAAHASREDDGGILIIVYAVCPRDSEEVRLCSFRRKGHNQAIEEGGDSVMTGICPSCGLDIVLDFAGEVQEKDRHAEAKGMVEGFNAKWPGLEDLNVAGEGKKLKDDHLKKRLEVVQSDQWKKQHTEDEAKAAQDFLEKLLGIPEQMRLPQVKVPDAG